MSPFQPSPGMQVARLRCPWATCRPCQSLSCGPRLAPGKNLAALPAVTALATAAVQLNSATPTQLLRLLSWTGILSSGGTTSGGTTTTTSTSGSGVRDLVFKYCSSREWCGVSPGSLTLSWSNDSIVWQPLWNHTFADLPSTLALGPGCTWETVTVPIPAAAAAAAHVAFKWVHLDASPTREASSPCSRTLLDDIVLPVQPPSAANMGYGKAPLASANMTAATCAACGRLCGTGSEVTMGGVRVGGGGGR
jgi:hypothetical protein